MNKPLHVAVAGGGIGGVTAALALARVGYQVTVLEQSPVLEEAGAGIQLSPNCVRVLVHLGLSESLERIGFLPQATEFRHWRTGNVISATPLGSHVVAKHGFAYYHVHRGDLLAALVEAASGQHGVRIVTDRRVRDAFEVDGRVVVDTGNDKYHADVLVGADGIHSRVRELLWGPARPRFTGNVAWRALVPADTIGEGRIRPVTSAWWGPGKHFVHYFVRGGKLINCVCVVEKSGWEVESWTEPGDVRELQADFAGWHEDLQRLIALAAERPLFKWALFDREPLPNWSAGRITLLGDACHPTLPFMAQGAAMAIEDAAVLSTCLDVCETPQAALLRYEQLRRKRTAGVQAGSRRNARTFHLSGIKAWLRNRAVRAGSGRIMDALYSYDALTAGRREASARD